jgi:hypothetical protein
LAAGPCRVEKFGASVEEAPLFELELAHAKKIKNRQQPKKRIPIVFIIKPS